MAHRYFHTPTPIVLGTRDSFLWQTPVTLSQDQIRTHMHVMGKSGSGKSRFLAGLFLNLISAGLSATLVDPHGDLARLVASHLLANGFYDRTANRDRVLYLDLPAAQAQDRFLPMNVLSQSYDPYEVGENTLEAMQRAWPELAHGAATFNLLVRDTVKVFVSNALPLTAAHRFLTDPDFRSALLANEPDGEVVASFRNWYDRFSPRDQAEHAASTLKRLRELTYMPVLRYSLGQRENLLNFRQILDRNQSVILNLGLRNTNAKRLLGCLIAVACEQAALSRADTLAEQRFGSHFLILDEFSLFSASTEEGLSSMLSQTRKYGLFVVMAHQNWSQTSERLRGAVQNAGIEVLFRLGPEDAAISSNLVGTTDPLEVKHTVADVQAEQRGHPIFYTLFEQKDRTAKQLTNLPTSHAILKRDLHDAAPIRALPVPDSTVGPERLAQLSDYYLTRYFRSKTEIEADTSAAQPSGAPSTTRSRPLEEAG